MSTLLSAGHLPPNRHDDLDNYHVGDDPFATPSPPSSPPPKKRKEPASASQGGGLGIDEEVSVAKRARLPNVKLDEDRLLGANGLPRLRQLARTLKLKGKGHEFSDAARLLSLYQMWLDDLFPKAKFLDALAMVEKAGHKKRVVAARNDFMNEGKLKERADHDDHDERQQDVARESVEGAEQDEGEGGAQTGGAQPTTPSRRDDGVPDDEDDLYDATPRQQQQQGRRTTAQDDGVPGDEDDLDALIAEAEVRDQGAAAAAARRRSLTPDEGDMDDLDALIAEAEAGDGSAGRRVAEHDFGDDEAAMQEMQG
ncbi:replication fork protection component Swi3 [Moelleriella libera RCEF 2490]|uniref:Chromosome segregation in meiosis protein n=1 Tax=Moelleriella libera RCEF 2490 TaxID=1081109 RepID=A0A162I4G6_9HYPO|nr:replication fork protection component Swi3 [Moelleriella libera RCEF 2490]